jgi:hypothetical protein
LPWRLSAFFSTSFHSFTRQNQAFIECFEYNYTGTNFYNVTGVKNDQSLLRVLSIAKECEAKPRTQI